MTVRPAAMLAVLLLTTLSGCAAPPTDAGTPTAGGQGPAPEPVLEAAHPIAEGTWSAIHPWGSGFLVAHLGDDGIVATLMRANWSRSASVVLVPSSAGVEDQRSIVMDGHLYLAFSNGTRGAPNSTLRLLRFDENLQAAGAATVIEGAPWNEPTNDFLLAAGNGRIHVGTYYVVAPSIGHRLRSYDASLSLMGERLLDERPHENGASLIADEKGFHLIAGVGGSEENRDLAVMHYGPDWTYLGETLLSVRPYDEYWPTGAVRDGAHTYVAHLERAERVRMMCPTCDTGQVRLKVFDADWRLEHDVAVTGPGVPAQRPHLLRVAGTTYAAHDVAAGEPLVFRSWVAELHDA